MKIVIIGYRGAGKSTVGQMVAQRRNWPYYDIDRGIEIESGKTLKQLYEGSGEKIYRDIEKQVVAQMCDGDARVISFGAGSLLNRQNQKWACHDSVVVYLQASAEILWRRIQSDPQSEQTRPNHCSGGLNEVILMLEKRAPVYLQCATLTLDATLPPEQLSERIIAAVPNKFLSGF